MPEILKTDQPGPIVVSHQGQSYLIHRLEPGRDLFPVPSRPVIPSQPDRGIAELLTICAAISVGVIGLGVLLRILFPPLPYSPPPPPPRPIIINNPPAHNPNCVAFCGGRS